MENSDNVSLLNMDLINAQFKSINEKLDKLTTIAEDTKVQEWRINQLEEKLKVMENKKSDVFWKVASPILSAFLAAIVSFIISGGIAK